MLECFSVGRYTFGMDIEHEILEIQKRNERVEMEKAWETSMTRKIVLTLGTYVLVVLVLIVLRTPRPFAGALIPALGYFISVQSLPFIKRYWLKTRTK